MIAVTCWRRGEVDPRPAKTSPHKRQSPGCGIPASPGRAWECESRGCLPRPRGIRAVQSFLTRRCCFGRCQGSVVALLLEHDPMSLWATFENSLLNMLGSSLRMLHKLNNLDDPNICRMAAPLEGGHVLHEGRASCQKERTILSRRWQKPCLELCYSRLW